MVNDVPPKDRDIAMVFQNYALYPHMTVYDNMAFGLKLRKFPKPEIEQRVQEAAEILGIQELLQRKPRALSGGQRQRVAVGRAIVRKPKVFLFDEPLSNLDAKLRVPMRAELKKLHDRLQATMIYVTHDQVEAMTMGDRIVVMKDGLIQQVGAPLELYDHPQNQFVAGFIGSPPMNFISCTVSSKDGQLFFTHPGLNLLVPSSRAKALAAYKDKPITMGIRPEELQEATAQDPANTVVRGHGRGGGADRPRDLSGREGRSRRDDRPREPRHACQGRPEDQAGRDRGEAARLRSADREGDRVGRCQQIT